MLSRGMDVEHALMDTMEESVRELLREWMQLRESRRQSRLLREESREESRQVEELLQELMQELTQDVKENRLGASRGSEEQVQDHGTVFSCFDEHRSPDQDMLSPWLCVNDLMGAEPVRVKTHPVDSSPAMYLNIKDCWEHCVDAEQVREENHRRSSARFGEHRSQEQNMLSPRVYSLTEFVDANLVPEKAHRTDFSFSGVHRWPGEYRSRLRTQRDFMEAGEVRDTSFRSLASERTLFPYVTGASVMALKYRDGILMAADMGGSYGSNLRYKTVERIKPIGKHSLLGASGEISDFQEMLRNLDELILYDNMWDDGNSFGPKEVHNYVTRVMYSRRNKFNPLWNSLVLGGVKNGQKYLGTVSMLGVSFEDNHVATGFGNHLARPILRDEWNENLSFEDGVKLLEKCMRVLLYRDRSAVNKLQIVKITEEGATTFPPYSLKTFWGFEAYKNPTVGEEGHHLKVENKNEV